MKLLVVVNNHNSLGALEFCVGLKSFDPTTDVAAVCSPAMARSHAATFSRLNVRAYMIAPDICAAPIKPATAGPSHPPATAVAPPPNRWRSWIARLPFYGLAREQLIVRRMRQCQKLALGIFSAEKPDAVITLSDRSHDYVEASTLWVGRRNGIPIIIPFMSHYDIDSALEYRRGPDGKTDPELLPFWPPSPYKWISWLRLRRQMHKGIFFQPPYLLNANRRAGTLSRYPWWVGHGLSDIVCVDSRHTAEKFQRHGVDPRKIAVTGHLAYDRVFKGACQRKTLKSDLFEKYSLDATRPLLVLSMPQYAEQGYMDWQEHWREIDAIMAGLCAVNANLLISLHPRSDRAAYRHLAEKFPCRFAEEALADIIGAADLFAASNSSTFNWAALCGVPSIAVKSPVRLLYDYLQTVHPVYDSGRIAVEAARILQNTPPSFEADWETLSRDHVFDGRFNLRFLELLHKVSAAAPPYA